MSSQLRVSKGCYNNNNSKWYYSGIYKEHLNFSFMLILDPIERNGMGEIREGNQNETLELELGNNQFIILTILLWLHRENTFTLHPPSSTSAASTKAYHSYIFFSQFLNSKQMIRLWDLDATFYSVCLHRFQTIWFPQLDVLFTISLKSGDFTGKSLSVFFKRSISLYSMLGKTRNCYLPVSLFMICRNLQDFLKS